MVFLRILLGCCMLISICKSSLHAEIQAKDFSPNTIQKQLLATRYISLIELSPDNKHLVLLYTHPNIFSSPQEQSSQWENRVAVKNNYASEKAHEVEFQTKGVVSSPGWTVDSKWISYINQGDKFASLWISPPEEYKPQKILELENNNIIEYRWSPDGKKLAVLVDIPPSNQSAIKINYSIGTPALYVLYIFDVDAKMKISNQILLTPENIAFANNKGNQFNWTPDGQNIVLSHAPLENGKASKFSQISLIPIKTQHLQTIEKGEGTYVSPLVSPDGKFVAYTTNDLPENAQNPIRLYEVDSSRICVTDLKSYEKKCLAKTPNENPFSIGWGKESRSLFVGDQEGNAHHIYELDLDGKALRRLTQDEYSLRCASLNSSRDMISYSAENLQTPSEGYVSPIDPFEPKKVVSALPSLLKNDFVVEKIQWKSKDDKFNLDGLFIYPKTTQQNSSFPLLTILQDYFSFLPPLGYVGDLSFIPLSYAALLEKGYALFIPNRRGSNGYGVQFRQALFKNLGNEDYEDVMTGIDHLIKEKKVDPQKLALWGWGYGGYLTAWTLIQTDRFKALVIGQGIVDPIAQIGTTNEPAFLEAVMGEPYWNDWQIWREKSSLSHIKSAKTPTLLQYGEYAETIFPSQGKELYFPLRTLGVPVQMISYQNQANVFSSPHITLLALQDLEEWLDTHLGFQPPEKKENNK